MEKSLTRNSLRYGLYDPDLEHSACGVGFLTRKDGVQTHDVLKTKDNRLRPARRDTR